VKYLSRGLKLGLEFKL